jgi:hypothetical protein
MARPRDVLCLNIWFVQKMVNEHCEIEIVRQQRANFVDLVEKVPHRRPIQKWKVARLAIRSDRNALRLW